MGTASPISLSHTERVCTTTIESPIQVPLHACDQCNRWGANTRNLVVCIDGTSNEFGQTVIVLYLFGLSLLTTQSEYQCCEIVQEDRCDSCRTIRILHRRNWHGSEIVTYPQSYWKINFRQIRHGSWMVCACYSNLLLRIK